MAIYILSKPNIVSTRFIWFGWHSFVHILIALGSQGRQRTAVSATDRMGRQNNRTILHHHNGTPCPIYETNKKRVLNQLLIVHSVCFHVESIQQRRRYLIRLANRLPSSSPLGRDWPTVSPILQNTNQLLRKVFHQWRVRCIEHFSQSNSLRLICEKHVATLVKLSGTEIDELNHVKVKNIEIGLKKENRLLRTSNNFAYWNHFFGEPHETLLKLSRMPNTNNESRRWKISKNLTISVKQP